MDWLLGVQISLKLTVSTYWVSIALLDRMLSLEVPQRSTFQCLGMACLMLANKIEDRHDRHLR